MPWKVVSMLWPAIVAALLPLSLADMISRLPSLIARLNLLDTIGNYRASQDRSRPRQVIDFKQTYADYIPEAA